MNRYEYKSRDGSGTLQVGVIEAASLNEAGRLLREQGRFVVSIHEAAAAVRDSGATPKYTGRVPQKLVITFAHQMAVMIETGVPISEALECVIDQCTEERFREVLEDIHGKVTSGVEFSKALSGYPKVFPDVMVSLIRAAEVSGTLGPMLERISVYMTKEQKTARKIKGALTYPAVMICMVLVVTVFLVLFVLPSFAGIYANRGAALPAPTRILMAMSSFGQQWWHVSLGVGAFSLIGLAVFVRTAFGNLVMDWLKLNTPVIGPLFNRLYLTRACRTMGTMIAAGVPVLEMIEIVRAVTRNHAYTELWDDVDDNLRQGAQLSVAMFASPLIPRSVSQMIFSGEKAGRLGDVMNRIAEYTEEEFDEQVRQATQFIEPAMVVIMGLIIGFVAIALLLPIFSVGQVVSG